LFRSAAETERLYLSAQNGPAETNENRVVCAKPLIQSISGLFGGNVHPCRDLLRHLNKLTDKRPEENADRVYFHPAILVSCCKLLSLDYARKNSRKNSTSNVRIPLRIDSSNDAARFHAIQRFDCSRIHLDESSERAFLERPRESSARAEFKKSKNLNGFIPLPTIEKG